MKIHFSHNLQFAVLSAFLLSGCAFMSQTGPQKKRILENADLNYQVIEIKSKSDLPSPLPNTPKGTVPSVNDKRSYNDNVRARDQLQFLITDLSEESPFTKGGTSFSFGPIEVPESGLITFPYVGELSVSGKSLAEIGEKLGEELKPISTTAEASVIRTGRIHDTANVIGEVNTPGSVNLEKSKVSSHDLLSASGGPNKPEHLLKYTLRRNGTDHVFNYEGFRQRVFYVEDGDLLTVTPDVENRFYVMGAINNPVKVDFPVPEPTLADALAAASGLDERRSDPEGVFVFREGNPDTVFVLNLKQPESIFLSQKFPIKGKDLVYITEAPLVRWYRLINQLVPVSQSIYNLDRATTN